MKESLSPSSIDETSPDMSIDGGIVMLTDSESVSMVVLPRFNFAVTVPPRASQPYRVSDELYEVRRDGTDMVRDLVEHVLLNPMSELLVVTSMVYLLDETRLEALTVK